MIKKRRFIKKNGLKVGKQGVKHVCAGWCRGMAHVRQQQARIMGQGSFFCGDLFICVSVCMQVV